MGMHYLGSLDGLTLSLTSPTTNLRAFKRLWLRDCGSDRVEEMAKSPLQEWSSRCSTLPATYVALTSPDHVLRAST